MIYLSTIDDLSRQGYTLAPYCLSCDRWGTADLGRLMQIGKGNRPVREAGFRCRDCGQLVEKQVRPPVPSPGGSVTYISI
ncbi:MAG: hypothetical protein ACE5OQ_11715 [Woeseia sp.]